MPETYSALHWPTESASTKTSATHWSHPGSNICLDFHGDPCRAKLVIFSDGNHPMALQKCLQAFLSHHPSTDDIFYATTPPAVLVELMKQGRIRIGNLSLSRQPDVFIGPENVVLQLVQDSIVHEPTLFMRSRCMADMVGTCQQTMKTVLGQLRKKSVIEIHQRHILIASMQKLEQLIEQGLACN